MITVQIPDLARREREYVLSVLLEGWLGLKYSLSVQPAATSEVLFLGERGSIAIPDLFLAQVDGDWLGRLSSPRVLDYHLRDDIPEQLSDLTGESNLPVLLGVEGETLVSSLPSNGGKARIRLGFDLLGAAFAILSRYEELLPGAKRDEHGRFPARGSCAERGEVLGRPVVNEYLELLWLLVQRIEPGAKRKERSFAVVPTHDVDKPFRYRSMSPRRLVRSGRARLRSGRSVFEAIQAGWDWAASKFGPPTRDPYFTFPWILSESEAAGLRSVFYVQCTQSDYRQDDNFDCLDPQITEVVADALERGHEVGVHPGYGTFDDGHRLTREISRFRQLWANAGMGDLTTLRSRQHFLRWDASATPGLLEDAGVDVDSTLGFADAPGFRCGCCYEYPLYDLRARAPLHLIEEPLILMECSMIDDNYLGLGAGEVACKLAEALWSKCRLFQGSFVFLWHNHRFIDHQEKELYESILAMGASPVAPS